MLRKLTITVSDEVYEGLHARIGQRRISKFIDSRARPHVVETDLEVAYKLMAADEEREKEAWEWSESSLRDLFDET